MNEKKIEPTDAMVADVGVVKSWFGLTNVRDILGLALNHPDAAGLFECDHTDYVHVDEAATRVEAAHEQGWDQATLWIDSYQGGPNGRTTSARSANPYRPAPVLPTKPGAVIVPADGHKHITATVGGKTYHAREAIFSCSVLWLGVWRSTDSTAVSALPEDITPGTWKMEEN